MKWTIFVVSALLPLTASAEFITCSDVYVERVSVQGDRDESHYFENKMILRLKGPSGEAMLCGNKEYITLSNTHPAYNGMLSIALTAFTTNKKISVSVNSSVGSSLSNQLSAITITE